MSCAAIHFDSVTAAISLGSIWIYGIAAVVILALLVVFFLAKKSKKSKKPTRKPASTSKPAPKSSDLQDILKILNQSNSQVLLAGSRLSELPVTIPVNLAVSLSASGKCLLIDLDTKRDALAKVFEVDSAGFYPHQNMLPVQTEFENLSIWPSKYFDLLKQMNLRSLLRAANKKYDHVLLYAPYLTALADRKQIAACSQQAIMFGQNGSTSSRLQCLLKACDCKVLLKA